MAYGSPVWLPPPSPLVMVAPVLGFARLPEHRLAEAVQLLAEATR